jgi:hypothetical protein
MPKSPTSDHLVRSTNLPRRHHDTNRINDSLKKKLDEGIKAREAKAKSGARKLVGVKEAEEEKAVKMLANSAMRMRMVVQVAGAQQQKQQQQ